MYISYLWHSIFDFLKSFVKKQLSLSKRWTLSWGKSSVHFFFHFFIFIFNPQTLTVACTQPLMDYSVGYKLKSGIEWLLPLYSGASVSLNTWKNVHVDSFRDKEKQSLSLITLQDDILSENVCHWNIIIETCLDVCCIFKGFK